MTGKETYRLHAEVFAALGNPLRHEIFHHLADGPKTVSELAAMAGVTPANVSQHVAILARHDLAVRRRSSGMTTWEAADARLAGACHLVDEVLAERLAGALESLPGKVVHNDPQ